MPNSFALPFKTRDNLANCIGSIINSNENLLTLVYPSDNLYQDEQTKEYVRNLFDNTILRKNKELFDIDLLHSDQKELAWFAIRGAAVDILNYAVKSDKIKQGKGFFMALRHSCIDKIEKQINEGIERWLKDDNQLELFDELTTIIINNNYNSFIIAMDNTTRHFKDNKIGKQHFLQQVQKEVQKEVIDDNEKFSKLLTKKYGYTPAPKTTIEKVDSYINLENSSNNKVCACTCAIL
jgi:hypothetical protein